MKYFVTYKCSMCGDKFHKGVININKKIQNHDVARTALFFNDKMQSYRKTHPAHICLQAVRSKDSVVLKCGVGEFVGLEIDDNEKLN